MSRQKDQGIVIQAVDESILTKNLAIQLADSIQVWKTVALHNDISSDFLLHVF